MKPLAGFMAGLFLLQISGAACTDELRSKAEDFDPSAYKGKVLYLDFWASWCGPCRASFPLMNDLRQKYSEQELAIVAVNLDGQRSSADQFLKRYPADFSILYDPEGVLASRYQLPGMPTSYTYDQQGKLVHTHIGFQESDATIVRNRLAKLLGFEKK